MTIEELIIYGKKYIQSDYVKMLLANLLNLNSLELLNHLDEKVSEDIIDKYKKQVDDIKKNQPIQYVIGNVDFYGYIIDVNDKVLIPRFETELLVEKTINYVNKYFNNKIDIADIGTGSGCISIALKNNLNCNIDAIDISKDALLVAQKNIEKYNLNINLLEGNILEPLNKKYDLIISNPPYIAYDEEIMDIVKNNEPKSALYADDKGLYFYKEIIKNSINYLKEKSIISFEIGSAQGIAIKEYAKSYYPNAIINIEKDLQNFDRFVFIINE